MKSLAFRLSWFVAAFIAVEPAPACPDEPPAKPQTNSRSAWLVIADIVEVEEGPEGYELTLERFVPRRTKGDPPRRRFKATLPLLNLPPSGRLLLIVDPARPGDPKVLLSSFVFQHVCVPEKLAAMHDFGDFFEGGWTDGTGEDRQLCVRF